MTFFSLLSRLRPQPPAAAADASDPAQPFLAGQRILWTARILVGTVSLLLLGLLGRVAQLQWFPPAPVAVLVGSQHGADILPANRGPLVDRQWRTVAASDTLQRLYVDPVVVEDASVFAERVGHALGYDPALIARAISERPESRFVVIDQNLNERRQQQLRRLHLAGLGVETRLVRRYPAGAAAGQLTGFVGFDGHGLEGLEKRFDSDLAGTPGRLVYLRDAGRRPLAIDADRYQAPVDGKPMRLSIDLAIQTIADEELGKACQEYAAHAGQIIVLDPCTGEVLAMANYPVFDPNDLGRSTADTRRNRCVTDFFEPGSIFKPYVWSAALQFGIARPSEVVDCGPGVAVMASGRRLHDAHPNNTQTWDGVLIKSSNIGMGRKGEVLGAVRMHRALAAFGFGAVPGTGLLGESPGMVNPLPRWTSYSVSSIPMGQEVGVTPLQISRAFAAFANGGFLVRPTIRPIDDPRQPGAVQVVGRVLTPEVAWHTREVLRRVVTEGTGKKAESKLYTIFGKTGTAQIPDPNRRGYMPGAYVGSFTAGAPLRRPRLVVGCFIQRPDPAKGYYGGIIAAPPVKAVIERSLQYLGVPPDVPPVERDSAAAIRTVAADARE